VHEDGFIMGRWFAAAHFDGSTCHDKIIFFMWQLFFAVIYIPALGNVLE